MYNPEDVLTKHGLREYQFDLHSLERALFRIANDADDLHIPEDIMDAVYKLQAACEEGGILWTGDGETDEDA